MNRRSVIITVMCCITIALWVVKEEAKQRLDMNDDAFYQLQQQLHDITIENMILTQKLLPMESYTVIASEAASMGMVRGGIKWVK